MQGQKDRDQDIAQEDPKVIHSGFTYFPATRQVLTLVIFAILEAEGIYLCIPFNTNTNVSFFIGQVILLAVTIYSWLHILYIVPGPMSELFKEDILKKAIEEGFNLNLNQNAEQQQQNICTSCQILKATKTYHCEYCNRSVYKSYFHSQWLNTCVSKENFPSFIAFLIFLFGYLVLLAAENLVVFYKIWDQNSVNFSIFFIANAENIIVSVFLFGSTFLVLIVGIMIVLTYYFAFTTRESTIQVGCIDDCQCQNRKGTSNDRILHKIRQSIRQSSFIRLKSLSAAKNHRNLFKDAAAANSHPFDLIFKVLQKASQSRLESDNQNNEPNQNKDTQKRLFTDLFSGILNLNKDKKESQSPIIGLKKFQPEEQINKENPQKSKWINYRRASFEKKLNLKRGFSMGAAFQDRNHSSRNEVLAELNKDLDFRGQLVMKMNSPTKKKLQQRFNQQQQDMTKQTMFKFTKKPSFFTSKLDDINEKQSHLQDENYSRKSFQQKKQKEQQSIRGFMGLMEFSDFR